MALPTNTYLTFSQKGIREDLSGVIYDVTPIETPFLSTVRHVDVNNTLYEWQVDSLAAASDLKALQGDDSPATAITATTRLNNRTQIATLDARVSGTAQSVDTAGRADELDYQVMRRGKELKRAMETTLLSNKIKVTGDSTTEPETAGIGAWITTNDVFDSGGSSPTAADGTDARGDGTQRAFTEAQLKAAMVLIYTSGGYPDTLMLGAFNRQVASGFGGGSTSMQKAEDLTLHATFDLYASDFGTLKLVPNRFQRARDALILQMDMWQVGFLPGRNMATWDIARTGDSEARQVLSEYGLLSLNEKASGGVFDLTTS